MILPIPAAPPTWASPWRRTANGPTTRTSAPLQVRICRSERRRAIYRSLYWNPLRADALPAGVDLSVFDMGVNAGIWGSARLLQRALGFTGEEVDGCVGPETLGAAAKCDPRTLVNDLAERQAAYYRSLSDFPTFGRGWLNRTEARRSAALAMIGDATPPTRPSLTGSQNSTCVYLCILTSPRCGI